MKKTKCKIIATSLVGVFVLVSSLTASAGYSANYSSRDLKNNMGQNVVSVTFASTGDDSSHTVYEMWWQSVYTAPLFEVTSKNTWVSTLPNSKVANGQFTAKSGIPSPWGPVAGSTVTETMRHTY